MLNSFDLSSYDSESTKIHTKVVVDVPKDGGWALGWNWWILEVALPGGKLLI